jgi:hypothetical protein
MAADNGHSASGVAHKPQQQHMQQHGAHAAPQRGSQGRVVEHLLAGGFDEALLQATPTQALNWAVKVWP